MSLTRRIGWAAALGGVALASPLLAGRAPQQVIQQAPPPASIVAPQTAGQITPEQPANGAISGVVLEGSTGEPVPAAIVNLVPGTVNRPLVNVQTRQITDDRGRFAFVNLPGEGQYTIATSKFGYLDGGYGRDSGPTGLMRTIALRQDEWISNLRVVVWKPGAISGVVRDESGDPVVGVFVRALVRLRIQGRDDLAAGPMAVTDDRGSYRLSGLSPGRYYVQVPSVQAAVPASTKFPTGTTPPPDALDVDDTHRLVIGRYPLPPPPVNGRQMAYPFIFHPSTSVLAQATAIDLGFGDDRPNIDLTLTPVPSVRVSGVIEGPPEALQSLTVRLLPTGLENLGLGGEAATALVGADGRFTFLNVPAGSYTLDAPVSVNELTNQNWSGMSSGGFRRSFPAPPPAQGWGMSSNSTDLIPGFDLRNTSFRGGLSAEYSGRTTLTVGGADVSGVVLRLKPHATMSGRVVVDADPAQPDAKPPARFPICLDPASTDISLGRPQSSFQSAPGEFEISGIVPGQYWLRVYGYPAWLVKSISWKGHDYTTMPFDAAAADDLSGVVLTVTNAVPVLSGSVRASDDLKADATMVIAFPADPAQWRNIGFWPARMKAAAVSNIGTYLLASLPAGDYLVVAVDRSKATTWRDPAFLTQAARSASRVTLTWGGKTSQDVSTVVVR